MKDETWQLLKEQMIIDAAKGLLDEASWLGLEAELQEALDAKSAHGLVRALEILRDSSPHTMSSEREAKVLHFLMKERARALLGIISEYAPSLVPAA